MAYFRQVKSKKAKRGYTWAFTIEAGVDPLTGKRKQITRRGFATKPEAVEAARELENNLARGMNVVDNKIPLSDYLIKWLDIVAKRKVRETTFINYERVVHKKINPLLGHIKLNDLKSAQCQKFINYLSDEGLSERYIEYIYTVFYGAMEKAIDWDLILKNPLRTVDIPRGRRRKYVTWKKEELLRFLNFAKFENVHYHALFFVCSYTGLRRGEVLGLKWEDFNPEEGTLHVQRNLIYDKLGFRFGSLKTEASDRIIKLDDSIMNVLKQHKKRQAEMKLLFGASYGKEDLIFSREDGQPIYPRTLTTIFNRVTKKAEVPKIRFHDLRHTHATLLLEAGVSLKEVQERLGHSSIKMTGDIYAHVTNTMKTNSAKKFSQYMQKNS